MKSYKIFIQEAVNLRRFLNKNKNLSKDQRDKIEQFFKVNRQEAKKIDWQSKEVLSWTWDNFNEIMMNSKYGLKTSDKMDCSKIKLRIPKDEYIRVKLSTKKFCAIIPLTWEAAKELNSNFGTCHGDYCIGDTRSSSNWNDLVVYDITVPVYVINNTEKWVVMIDMHNDYEVWNKDNVRVYSSEPIPGFSIKNELLNPKIKKLYDNVRDGLEEAHADIDISFHAYLPHV